MGTVSKLHDRVRPPAHRIESDEEAMTIARTLAADFGRSASDRDINRVLPQEELEALSQSGLLGITVPAEHGGLDISNSILAEIIAALSEGDPSIGEFTQGHFGVLEGLRVDGNEDQKAFFCGRALAGDRFGAMAAGDDAAGTGAGPANVRLAPHGLGYRLSAGKFHTAGALFADWLSVFALDPAGRLTISILPRDAEGVKIIDDWDGFGQRTAGGGTTVLHNVHVDADGVIYPSPSAERATIDCVGRIAHAGVDLGIARAAFADMVDFVKHRARAAPASGVASAPDDTLTIARVGQIATDIEAAAAMVERAGRKVDAAQVSPTEAHVVDATLSVAVAGTLAAEVAVEAANSLFELAGTPSTRIGLNLDRHWRNARTHTLQDPVRSTYHAVGNYHVNGVAPSKVRGRGGL